MGTKRRQAGGPSRRAVIGTTALLLVGSSIATAAAMQGSDSGGAEATAVTYSNGAVGFLGAPGSTEHDGPPIEARVPAAKPGELIVQFRSCSAAAREEAVQAVDPIDEPSRLGPRNQLVIVDPETTNEAKATLVTDPCVAGVFPNEILPAADSSRVNPNDPFFAQQWHLAKTNAPSVWPTTRGAGIVVAVLDSGVDPNEPDLAGRLVPGANLVDPANASDTTDTYGHGTAVATVAAATNDNGVGIASTAPETQIMPVVISFLDDGGLITDTAHVIAGLTYATANRAKVANISYDVGTNLGALKPALTAFQQSGGVAVFAAGNSGLRFVSKSLKDDPLALVVGATDQTDRLARWTDMQASNTGNHIDIWAPGSDIVAAVPHSPGEPAYAPVNGTSFATPQVSATVALMMAASPGLKATDAVKFLKETSTKGVVLTADNPSAAGRLDVLAAVTKVLPPVATASVATTVNLGSLGAAIAPASIARIDGTGLATSPAEGRDTDADAPGIQLPTTLAGTSVTVRDAAGVDRLAPLFSVSSTTVTIQVPERTAPGTATISVVASGGARATSIVEVTPTAPGILTADGSGRGWASGSVVIAHADGTQSSSALTTPFALGAESDAVYLVLYGVGIRGPAGAAPLTTATVDGVSVPVAFAGAQGYYVGLDQVNLGPLPRALASRGTVKVVVTAGEQPSNAVDIAIA